MEILKKWTFFFLICIHGCASKTANPARIRMVITDKNVQNNSFINLTIYNDTKNNIYLPMDTSTLGEDVDCLSATDEQRFFLPMINIERIDSNKWIPINIYCEDYIYLESLGEKWKSKLSKLKMTDLIIIKSHNFVKLNLPFKLRHVRTKYCSTEYENYQNFKNGEYQAYISYDLRASFEETFLQKNLIDSINTMGYKIYDGKLISNKLPLLIKD